MLLVAQPAPVFGQDSKKADNTGVNKRDRNQQEPTADQQKENRSDREITQQIRRSILDDKSLSTNAHNVKIITQNGSVTLKGPVRSEEEKRVVEEKAREVAGAKNVNSEVEVAVKTAKKNC
jgi:hyperosmotically inducible periplasmic protein